MCKNSLSIKLVYLLAPVAAAILACSTLAPVSTPPQSLPPAPSAVAVAPASNAFVGTWVSVDSDGSNQQIVITQNADNTFTMDYIDYGASACGKDSYDKPLYSATANGVLTGTGSTLSGTLGVYCQRNPAGLLSDINFQFTYDAGSGKLTDNWGVVWTKQ